jgi:phosphocarrier protein HPr
MKTVELEVLNPEGLHARPAGVLAKKVAEFQSTVEIQARGQTKSARSLMAIMSLGVKGGERVTISATGADEDAVVEAIGQLFKTQFGLH